MHAGEPCPIFGLCHVGFRRAAGFACWPNAAVAGPTNAIDFLSGTACADPLGNSAADAKVDGIADWLLKAWF